MAAINKKRIIIYAACAFCFALAGVFQAVDSYLPEFWHALFALLAHTILISLVVAWGVSVVHRTARKDLRSFFVSVAAFILFFLVVRMIKYGLTEESDTLSRYLWYSYYVPQCLIPPTILLAALSLENKNGKPLKKMWYLLYLPAVLLLILIYTNDLHELVFAFDFNGKFSYRHRVVFFIALAWEISVTFSVIIVLIHKCGVSACRKRIWIPITVFIACAAVSAVCFLTNTSAFKIPELLCFTCVAVIESCVCIGLISSNDEYENFFYRSAYSAIITDEDFNAIYRSEKSPHTDKQTLELATKTPVMLDENARLTAEKIHGGYVFLKEDVSEINRINAALKEANERLSEENYIIEAENEMKAQKARIAEQSRLYAKIDEYTKCALAGLSALLAETGSSELENGAEFVKTMRAACVIAAYVKRRSNLVMIAEKSEFIEVEELSLSIKESLDYLLLAGAECSYDCGFSGKISGKATGDFYDFFEECVVDYKNLPAAVVVRFFKRGGNIVLFIESDACAESISDISTRLNLKFARDYNIEVKSDGEAVYYSLISSCGGII